MASKMSEKMFGNSPKMERGEDGKMAIKKKAAEKEGKDTIGEAEDQGTGEQVPMHHSMDRMSLHHKHEMEHMAHKGGDKKEMHKRHMEEHESMMKRHDKEMGKKE